MEHRWNTPEGKKEIKKKYFKKIYDNAPIVKCACGCDGKMRSKDRYGRDKKYIVGHGARKYNDPTQYKREWNHRNRSQRYTYKVQRAHNKKIEFINDKGSKCEHCGIKYDGTNAAMFDFHHIDPSNKEFGIGLNTFNRMCLERILAESKKCILLCSNCHRLLHFGGW